MEEVWKDIAGWEGMYQVSNLGRVKSLPRKIVYKNGRIDFIKGKILTKSENEKGYYFVTLIKNSKRKMIMIHQLVARAFIKNPNGFKYVNHIDENRKNNCVNNLEWCNNYYNQLYSKGKPVKGTHLRSGKCLYFATAREAEKYGFNSRSIGNCCNQKQRHKNHNGYKWEFIKE